MSTVTRIVSALFCWVALFSAHAQAPAPRKNTNAPAPPATTATNAPYKIPENKIIEFNVPLSASARLSVIHSKNPPVDYVRVAIAVPEAFDPEIPTQILLINGTSDGIGSSIRPMVAFTNIALRLGWIVIAADAPMKPPDDSPPWRWAMISSLLDHINKAWPGSKRWPIVTAGISGGGKWAGVIGAILSQKGYNLIGVFMGAVNQDFASEAAKLYDPAIRFKQVPFYVSSGTDDKIATPEQHQQVKESLLSSGFGQVRLETFKGGHALSEAELKKALSWFIDLYTKDSVETK
jgi:hypothetical protein